jgi:hypothetical protein
LDTQVCVSDCYKVIKALVDALNLNEGIHQVSMRKRWELSNRNQKTGVSVNLKLTPASSFFY